MAEEKPVQAKTPDTEAIEDAAEAQADKAEGTPEAIEATSGVAVDEPEAPSEAGVQPAVERGSEGPKEGEEPHEAPTAEEPPSVEEPSVESPADEATETSGETEATEGTEAGEVAAAPPQEGGEAPEVPKVMERTFADELREEYGDIETAKLDILPDLERKRDRLNALAEEHKSKRDRLNAITKQLAEERDAYNGQVRELVQTANDHRNTRNRLNHEVKDAKVVRDELNKKAAELNESVQKLKRERQGETGGPSLGRLRNELRALEFKMETSVLTSDKEKELIDTIKRLKAQYDAQERKMEENREVRNALRDSRKAKEDAERQHKLVSELARQAQTAHDTMIELYERADELRKKADDCQSRFITNKQLADAEHKAHIDLIRKVHDYDKFISGLRRRERRARKDRQEKAQKRVAEDMMDRFKKGEKLSTEDLLSLQTERY